MKEGFVGCISRVEFDDIYPLKLLFQQNGPGNVHSLGGTCAVVAGKIAEKNLFDDAREFIRRRSVRRLLRSRAANSSAGDDGNEAAVGFGRGKSAGGVSRDR